MEDVSERKRRAISRWRSGIGWEDEDDDANDSRPSLEEGFVKTVSGVNHIDYKGEEMTDERIGTPGKPDTSSCVKDKGNEATSMSETQMAEGHPATTSKLENKSTNGRRTHPLGLAGLASAWMTSIG